MPTPIFQITRCLWLGPFASPQRINQLREVGITHVLNVSEAPSVLTCESAGLTDIRWHPLDDMQHLPIERVLEVLESLHAMALQPDSRVYVHCIAGQNRSPTVLWLYLLACGVANEVARELISRRAMDAVPGHRRLVGDGLVIAAKQLGQAKFLPLTRPEIIDPVK